ncbi:MAG: transposase [bacterium]|nr:transposase [bacterium]MDE0288491.1 transposase [bacterium]MDE0439242.1 transposase [bacterium]
MPYRYPPEFRRKVLDLLAAGRSVASLSADLGVSDQTIYNWRRQDAIDRGLERGLTSSEKEELRAARRRIVELEIELAVTRRANELLGAQVVTAGDGSKRSRRWEARGCLPGWLAVFSRCQSQGSTSGGSGQRQPAQSAMCG